jgi:hypothetical protein
MPRRLATTYVKLHHGVLPPPEPSPPTSESSGYVHVLEDDDTEASMSSDEEDEPPPPCGLLQASLLGSFETAHREASTREVQAITLEQTNAAITSRVGEISVEFTAKEVAAKKLMAAER